MANVIPTDNDNIASIYQIESTDAVQGGINQMANVQAKAIANSLLFLKNRQANYLNAAGTVFNQGASTYTLNVGDVGKVIHLSNATNDAARICALPALTTLKEYFHTFIIHFHIPHVTPGVGGCLKIQPAGSDVLLINGNTAYQGTNAAPWRIYPGEKLLIWREGSQWQSITLDGTSGNIGGAAVPAGTLTQQLASLGATPHGWKLCNGATYNTDVYKRLQEIVAPAAGATFAVPNITAVTLGGVSWNYIIKL